MIYQLGIIDLLNNLYTGIHGDNGIVNGLCIKARLDDLNVHHRLGIWFHRPWGQFFRFRVDCIFIGVYFLVGYILGWIFLWLLGLKRRVIVISELRALGPCSWEELIPLHFDSSLEMVLFYLFLVDQLAQILNLFLQPSLALLLFRLLQFSIGFLVGSVF